MKILLLTPLFPPDTGEPAAYVKELAARLTTTHETTLLMYGRLPESVPGVMLLTVDKRQPLPRRLFKFTLELWRQSKTAELIIVNSAPSTELPALLVSLFSPTKMILCESDSLAVTAATSGVYKFMHTLLKRRCIKVIAFPDSTIYEKPEVLPFTQISGAELTRRATWWDTHITELTIV
jgi:hypothetical protein